MDRCKSCHAPILWATTGRSKIPLDPDPVEGGNIKIVSQGHTPLVAVVPPDGTARWVTHFVTCKQADKHRRK